ncbi:hypothetical protein [Pseudomonas sp. S2_F03]
MPMKFDDAQLRVDVDEDISAIGQSFSQALTNGIVFTIKSPNGKMIQFKSRTMKWLEGPQVDNYVTDIEGYFKPDALDWDVDVVPREASDKKTPTTTKEVPAQERPPQPKLPTSPALHTLKTSCLK